MVRRDIVNMLDIGTLVCPDCGYQLDISNGNLVLLDQEARRVHGHRPMRWDISRVPDDLDLTGPLTADDVRRVVAVSVIQDDGEAFPWPTSST
jgi:hypothetical protein